MNHYISLYRFYNSFMLKSIRFVILLSLVFWFITDLSNNQFPKFSMVFLHIFVMFEIFFHFKIAKIKPITSVSMIANGDIHNACTKEALLALYKQEKTSNVIKNLIDYQQVIFILTRANIATQEINLFDILKDQLMNEALNIVKKIQGSYITTMDIFVAYLLLTEAQTKLLFTKELKEDDIFHILSWARLTFSFEEHPKKNTVSFNGDGIGGVLTTGWTLETQKYTKDFTAEALQENIHLIGQEKMFHDMLEALSKKENNNVLLTGDVGIGKENLIRYLASNSFSGKLSIEPLNHKKVLQLMVGLLIAGTDSRADLESRLQAIIDEISHAGNVILYIPEFEHLFGSTSFNLDISGALLPYLRSGKLPIIASMTFGNYKTYVEKNPILETFEVIKLDPPDTKIALQMLFEKTQDIEEKNHVIITYKAVFAAVSFANRYMQDGILPGSAITLLEETASNVALGDAKRKIVLEEDVIKKIESKTNVAIAEPKGQEKELLLHLEEKLHERVVDQVDAISRIAKAMQRLRTGFASQTKPISFLFLGPTGVGKTETAKALAETYFGKAGNMIRLDMSEYSDETGVKKLLGAPPGEGSERGLLTDQIHDHPFSLVLLDEFEKANQHILDLFLQVLEDGRLTDNKGVTVSFVNAIIIATSNAGSEFIREEVERGTIVDKLFQQRLLEYLQVNHIFKPELLNRFDDVVTYKPLGESEIKEITKMLLTSLTEQLADEDITATFDDKIIEKITKEGFDKELGARPIRRYIQDNIEDLLAQKKLQDQIKRGDKVNVTTDRSGQIIIVTS